MNKSYKILVAEDSELMLDLLATEIKEHLPEADLTLVGDGAQAMRLAMDESFDLILTDNVMPGMMGSTLLRKLRDSEGPNQPTPFIFCSGNYSYQEIKGLRDCWVLQKPFDMTKLQGLLTNILPH